MQPARAIGCKCQIELSGSISAYCLIAVSHRHLLLPNFSEKREEKVEAKGKGALETFFLKQNYNRQPGTNGNDNSESSSARSDGHLHDPEATSDPNVFSEKTNRLIDWNVETLVRLLKQLVGRRKAISQSRTPTIASAVVTNFSKSVYFPQHSDYLKEVKEIITFPEFDGKVDNMKVNVDDVKLPPLVHEQLRTYVSCIAGMYQDNHFHNFDHASHVLMSVTSTYDRYCLVAAMCADFFRF